MEMIRRRKKKEKGQAVNKNRTETEGKQKMKRKQKKTIDRNGGKIEKDNRGRGNEMRGRWRKTM